MEVLLNSRTVSPSQLSLFPSTHRPQYDTRFIEPLNINGRVTVPTELFPLYWHFAAERQKIFFRRIQEPHSLKYTSDPTLAEYKFTNAYRASDRVSQYLIRRVIYRDDLPKDDEEIFFRIILFKIFNNISTWECLERHFGSVTLSTFTFSDYDRVLSRQMDRGHRIYSSAYIMPSAKGVFGCKRKHQNHLLLIEFLLSRCYPALVRSAHSLEHCYRLLLDVPSLGPFLAFQYTIDLNYSELLNFPESDFVVAGPGALDGIAKCFVSSDAISPEEIINHFHAKQDYYFSYFNCAFPSLWGRPLQPIDCQNLFCEISKYARAVYPNIQGRSGRTRIKQRYRSTSVAPRPWYPPKWDINHLIDRDTSVKVPRL